MTHTKIAERAFLVAGITIVMCLITCTSSTHGTLTLYEKRDGRSPATEGVAHVLMNDMLGFGRDLAVRFDSRGDFGPKDTLEILPGEHSIQLRVSFRRDPKYNRFGATSRYSSNRACLHFDFVAEAGHTYAFVITKYTLSNWRVDLVDRTSPQVVHGSPCPAWKRYPPIHE